MVACNPIYPTCNPVYPGALGHAPGRLDGGVPGRPGDGCEAGAAADRAAGSYRRLQCRGMLK
eukprot:scaffold138584_cov93-Phaeocystis_antarctica.AAC.2